MGSIYGWIFTSFLPPLFHYIYHYHPLEIFVRAFFFFSGIDLWHAKGYALRVLKKKKHWKGLVWVLSGCVKYQVGKGGGVCVAKFSFLSGEKKKRKEEITALEKASGQHDLCWECLVLCSCIPCRSLVGPVLLCFSFICMYLLFYFFFFCIFFFHLCMGGVMHWLRCNVTCDTA